MADVPIIDPRTASQIESSLRDAAPSFTPEWNVSADPGHGGALVRVFAEMTEAVLSRLNRVPAKGFAAFLGNLGVSLMPARPSRAPMTFQLSPGLASAVLIPAGTRVAAPATAEHPELIYETERSFSASGAALTDACCVNPPRDEIFDYAGRISNDRELALFQGDVNSQRHVFYIGHDALFHLRNASVVTLYVEASEGSVERLSNASWQYWADDEAKASPFAVAASPLGGGYSIRLTKPESKVEIGKKKLCGVETCWIRCSVTGAEPLSLSAVRILNAVPSAADGILPDALFYNGVPMDPAAKFRPFGSLPRQFDTLYVSSAEAFSKPGATVSLIFRKDTKGQPNGVSLQWEYWSGKVWKPLTLLSSSTLTDFSFVTNGVDQGSQGIAFTCPDDIRELDVNGLVARWIRVRLVEGNYGTATPGANWTLDLTNVHPPICASAHLVFSCDAPVDPRCCVAFNNRDYALYPAPITMDSVARAVVPMNDSDPTIHLCFNGPLREGNASIFFSLAEDARGYGMATGVAWSYWSQAANPITAMVQPDEVALANALGLHLGAELLFEQNAGGVPWRERAFVSAYDSSGVVTLDRPLRRLFTANDTVYLNKRLSVVDNTDGLLHSGTLEFLGPADQCATGNFGLVGYWIVGRVTAGYPRLESAVVRGIYPDTTWAAQVETVRDAILGSSGGGRNESFTFPRVPVVAAEIRVREAAVLLPQDMAEISMADVSTTRDHAGRVTDTWVTWRAVDDLSGAGPRDRVYFLDHSQGSLSFGNGEHGMIPPTGRDNIRATFTCGGGAAGNAGRNEVTKMKSSLAGVAAVRNPEPAEGGADTEYLADVFRRGASLLKHRERAVSEEDFQRITLEASSFIERVKCVATAGILSVFIIPRGKEPQPTPSAGLKRIVRDYLMRRCPSTLLSSAVEVLDPRYKEIRVTARIQPTSLNGAVALEKTIVASLESYFHPLTGGREGTGWEFGRGVHASDVYAFLERIDGVDHVASLRLNDSTKLCDWSRVLDPPAASNPDQAAIRHYLADTHGMDWILTSDAPITPTPEGDVTFTGGPFLPRLSVDPSKSFLTLLVDNVIWDRLRVQPENGALFVWVDSETIDVESRETICSGVHDVTLILGS